MTDADDRRGWVPLLAGVAAAALGAGLGQLAAAFLSPAAGPIAVVGSALIDLAPAWAKDTAIALFGTADKIALVVGITLVLLAVAAAAGALEARRPPLGRLVFVLLGVAGVVAAVTRADAGGLAAVPSIIAGGAAAITVMHLARLARAAHSRGPVGATPAAATATATAPTAPAPASAASDAPPPGPGPASAASDATTPLPAPASAASGATPPGAGPGAAASVDLAPRQGAVPDSTLSRRTFFAWSGVAIGVGALAALGAQLVQGASRAVGAIRDAVRLPAPVTRASVPAAADLGIPGVAPLITPNGAFYRIDTAILVPQVDPADWSLRIHGMVEEEVVLTWADVLALPLSESTTTLACVSNEVGGDLIGTAVWLGYPVRELLARARPTAEADMVLSRSVDGFTASTPLEVLTDERDAVLAVGMNGEPLPIEHGFPARLVVPGLYGYVSATKWVSELEVTRFDRARAYWSDRGWSERGPIKLQSRIDVPRRGIAAGDTVIAGVAWHQHVGVAGVEVQIDDGAWQRATLAPAISDDTWVQWSLPWAAAAGSHRIRCRAISTTGEVQTPDEAPPAPDGATGHHTIDVTVS
ncbi:molybdopterin-dependent oxidoreductase [Microbacterium sp. W1N]|uniref:molybdopterin-dependent oxidoreductase n=1 Tax=Microbacterium festucae TaxID=2977531 RepID=UPI0021C24748|nr:molybdopterin-dependent oxidoreductase [Microbacterium festucae]MCT9819763.1 molybdopterin-dependent oxidoreductase [Microbacterium festucae]